MTTDPPVYEDWNGDLLHVFAQADDIRVTISQRPDDDCSASVDIPFADVLKVTAAMHEKAGLPDRWAEMRCWLDAKISGLLAEAQTETVLMARNLRRDARLLTTVRDQMDAAEGPVPAPQEDQ